MSGFIFDFHGYWGGFKFEKFTYISIVSKEKAFSDQSA